MATIKYVFFYLTLSALLDAHHARHLHDISIHEILDRVSTFQVANVISMVTGRGKPPRPPPAPSQGQTTYGADNTKSDSVTTPTEDLAEILTSLSEAITKPKSKPAPSQGQTTYGADNTKSDSVTTPTEDLADIQATKPTTSIMDKIMYGRIDPSVQTTPKPAELVTYPTISESLCVNGGSECTGLSISFTNYDDKIVYQMKISVATPAISSY